MTILIDDTLATAFMTMPIREGWVEGGAGIEIRAGLPAASHSAVAATASFRIDPTFTSLARRLDQSSLAPGIGGTGCGGTSVSVSCTSTCPRATWLRLRLYVK